MNNAMVCGDKSRLALEAVESVESPETGLIFLYVNDIKFGYDLHPYGVEASIRNFVDNFCSIDFGTKNLIYCPASVLFSAYDTCFKEDIDEAEDEYLNNDRINEYYPRFHQEYLEDLHLANCYCTLGQYTFDSVALILIPKGDTLRLYVRNNATGAYTDTVTTDADFLNLWKCLLTKWLNRSKNATP